VADLQAGPAQDGLVIRLAEPADADAAADVWIRSRHAAYPAIPRSVHDDADMHRHFTQVLMPAGGVWLAELDGLVVGVLVVAPGWVEQLYVAPGWTGRGIGSRLLASAQAQQDALELWVFESNVAARRFYERHGFVEVGRTDGEGNEERAPDVRYRWQRAASAQASSA
jgi:GNAT superfamily N-acetyltransferase